MDLSHSQQLRKGDESDNLAGEEVADTGKEISHKEEEEEEEEEEEKKEEEVVDTEKERHEKEEKLHHHNHNHSHSHHNHGNHRGEEHHGGGGEDNDLLQYIHHDAQSTAGAILNLKYLALAGRKYDKVETLIVPENISKEGKEDDEADGGEENKGVIYEF